MKQHNNGIRVAKTRRGGFRLAGIAGVVAVATLAAPQAAGAAEPRATTTTLTAPKTTFVYGEPARLTSTVTDSLTGAPLAGHSMEWTRRVDDGLAGFVMKTDDKGTTTFGVGSIPAGEHAIRARSLTDATYESSSDSVDISVLKASTTTAITAPEITPRFSAATVTVNVGAVAPGGGYPDGTVTLRYNGGVATEPVAWGRAIFKLTPVQGGNHLMTAIYSGSGNHESSLASTWFTVA